MPVTLHCKTFILSAEQVKCLWQTVLSQQQHRDDEIAVRCVARRTSAELNRTYRGRVGATNVLTFSYDAEPHVAPEHDVALCLPLIRAEARQRRAAVADYTALVLSHAFLHACGLDHTARGAAQAFARAEREVLERCGFRPLTW